MIMAKYDRATMRYVTVEYPLTINFPADKVICDYCPLCKAENAGTRFRCLETGEILIFHNVDYGLRCPLPLSKKKIESEEEE